MIDGFVPYNRYIVFDTCVSNYPIKVNRNIACFIIDKFDLIKKNQYVYSNEYVKIIAFNTIDPNDLKFKFRGFVTEYQPTIYVSKDPIEGDLHYAEPHTYPYITVSD